MVDQPKDYITYHNNDDDDSSDDAKLFVSEYMSDISMYRRYTNTTR